MRQTFETRAWPCFVPQNTAPKNVFGGWTLAGIVTFQSGRGGGAVLSGDSARVGGGRPQRLNFVGEPNGGPKTLENSFDTSAFDQSARDSWKFSAGVNPLAWTPKPRSGPREKHANH